MTKFFTKKGEEQLKISKETKGKECESGLKLWVVIAILREEESDDKLSPPASMLNLKAK